ncbi:MAG: sigma 54-interacting transcriptional regulator [Kofleriaceae bacterium]
MSSPGPGWVSNTADASSTGGGSSDADSLLCIRDDRSFRVKLPASGELVIGRGPDAGCSIDDALVSRAHAQILVGPEGLRISDLGSRHGTLVNGDRITEPRTLRGGDVITIGNTVFVVRKASTARAKQMLETSAFVTRLTEELARCTEFEREMSLLCVRAVDGELSALVPALVQKLRSMDTLATIGRRHLGVLLPELDADEAVAMALRLIDAAPGEIMIGVATAPYDGIDPDALMAATRAACEVKAHQSIVRASEAAKVLIAGSHRIVIGDPAMANLYELAKRIARSSIPVLVRGETGVGKELAAAMVHAASPRANKPFISVNCAAIPDTLAESELFGHVKGSFSGAVANKVGYIEASDGGTLFLDEIGELSLPLQAKLLRVLETGEVARVGEVTPRKLDLRIVAATNRDLQREIEDGKFRSDLYFRLGAARLEIPPLSERPGDLALLASSFVHDACAKLGRPALELSTAAAIALFRHTWPGNIRELRHVVEYAAAAVPDGGSTIELWHLPEALAAAARRERDHDHQISPTTSAPHLVQPPPMTVPAGAFRPIADEVRELERSRMIAALRASQGVQNRAAELIEMPLRTFVTKLKRYGITPADWQ